METQNQSNLEIKIDSQLPKKEVTWRRRSGDGIKYPPNMYRHFPSDVFYVRVSINGHRSFKTLDTTSKSVAIERLKLAQADAVHARQEGCVRSEVKFMGDLAQKYLDEIETGKLAPNTKSHRKVVLAKLLACWKSNEFSKLRPERVTLGMILALQKVMLEEGTSPSYMNKVMQLVSLFLRKAVRLNLRRGSIFDEPENMKKIMFARVKKEYDLPTPEMMEKLLVRVSTFVAPPDFPEVFIKQQQEHCWNTGEHVRLIAYSGLRLGEAVRLRWEDVLENTLLINKKGSELPDHGKAPNAPVGKTKSSTRELEMNSRLKGLIESIRARRMQDNIPLTGPVLLCKTSINAIQRACSELGLKPLTHHALRHYFATTAQESQIDVLTISNWLGHGDGGRLVMDTYFHSRSEHRANMALRLNFGENNTVPAKTG